MVRTRHRGFGKALTARRVGLVGGER